MGKSRDFVTQDLYESIQNSEFPSWIVYVQIMNPNDVDKFKYDHFDVTKIWYHNEYPLIEIVQIVLNKNPENYFAEVDKQLFNQQDLFQEFIHHQTKCYKQDYLVMKMHKDIDWM